MFYVCTDYRLYIINFFEWGMKKDEEEEVIENINVPYEGEIHWAIRVAAAYRCTAGRLWWGDRKRGRGGNRYCRRCC
ncbi:hypothetical protein GCM10010913_03190 [Paenibacillus aceti]|uniref:Uncharacterized protein n=1 Tax=Paenibacillus aceti TaxID=1820010 RepID=A0ABQ1VNX2_9BACL|nr:hypothetical protein GCM10010913_03190 [Paenibacillus aceti]